MHFELAKQAGRALPGIFSTRSCRSTWSKSARTSSSRRATAEGVSGSTNSMTILEVTAAGLANACVVSFRMFGGSSCCLLIACRRHFVAGRSREPADSWTARSTSTASAETATNPARRPAYPVILAANRRDLAFATGFAHAQDRFFQMDLIRRKAAGELSELVGAAAIEIDKQSRFHRFPGPGAACPGARFATSRYRYSRATRRA